MKPIDFKEQNVVFAKDQPEYQPLPAFKRNSPRGEVISCWKISLWERLQVLFTGKLWVSMWTFNKPLTPSLFTTKKSDVLITKKQRKSILDSALTFLGVSYTIMSRVGYGRDIRFYWKGKKITRWFRIPGKGVRI